MDLKKYAWQLTWHLPVSENGKSVGDTITLHWGCLYVCTGNLKMSGINLSNVVWSTFSKTAKLVKIWWWVFELFNFTLRSFFVKFSKNAHFDKIYWKFILRLPLRQQRQIEDVGNILKKRSLSYIFQNCQVFHDFMISFQII